MSLTQSQFTKDITVESTCTHLVIYNIYTLNTSTEHDAVYGGLHLM